MTKKFDALVREAISLSADETKLTTVNKIMKHIAYANYGLRDWQSAESHTGSTLDSANYMYTIGFAGQESSKELTALFDNLVKNAKKKINVTYFQPMRGGGWLIEFEVGGKSYTFSTHDMPKNL